MHRFRRPDNRIDLGEDKGICHGGPSHHDRRRIRSHLDHPGPVFRGGNVPVADDRDIDGLFLNPPDDPPVRLTPLNPWAAVRGWTATASTPSSWAMTARASGLVSRGVPAGSRILMVKGRVVFLRAPPLKCPGPVPVAFIKATPCALLDHFFDATAES